MLFGLIKRKAPPLSKPNHAGYAYGIRRGGDGSVERVRMGWKYHLVFRLPEPDVTQNLLLKIAAQHLNQLERKLTQHRYEQKH